MSNNGADEDNLSCFSQQTYSRTATVCVVVVVAVVVAAAVSQKKKKTQPVAEPRNVDEENYSRVLQHPKI